MWISHVARFAGNAHGVNLYNVFEITCKQIMITYSNMVNGLDKNVSKQPGDILCSCAYRYKICNPFTEYLQLHWAVKIGSGNVLVPDGSKP